MRWLALALVLVASRAWADESPQAALKAAEARAASGDPGALDALEAVGRMPASAWTDNAWREAARLAEKRGEFARARADYAAAVAADTEPVERERDAKELARIEAKTAGGAWDAVAAEHERLVSAIQAPGDPVTPCEQLEALVEANPRYPRRGDARLAAARGWDRIGYLDREEAVVAAAIADAPAAADLSRARTAMVRVRIGQGALAAAREEAARVTDPSLRAELDDEIDRAALRQRLRWLAWGALAMIAAAAVATLRRDAGSWGRALRRLARAPGELLYFAPIALVLAVIAAGGNPLVSGSVIRIVAAGAAVAWISGALLDGAARVRGRRVLAHAVLAVVAIAAAAYLSVDRGRMLDLVVETWRGGPER